MAVGFGYLIAPDRPVGRTDVGVIGCGVAGRCVTITNFCCCAGCAAGRWGLFVILVVLLQKVKVLRFKFHFKLRRHSFYSNVRSLTIKRLRLYRTFSDYQFVVGVC